MAKYLKQGYKVQQPEFAELLAEKNLTVKEFASASGIALGTAYRLVNGDFVQFGTICKVTAFFDIKPEDYFVLGTQNVLRADLGQSPESKNGAAIE